MLKSRIRRWTWILAAVFAVLSFFFVAVILREGLTAALIGALIGGAVPVVIGGGMLFAPPSSAKSPLRYMGRKPPVIDNSDDPEQARVIRKPHKKSGRRR